MKDFEAAELSEPKYVSGKYELRQVLETGRWAIFRSFRFHPERPVIFMSVDDDWGAGNIEDESLFSYRVLKLEDEVAAMMSEL